MNETLDPGHYRKILEDLENNVVSQNELRGMVSRAKTEEFIKNTPVALVPYARLSDYVPSDKIQQISELIGGVDKTTYDENTLANGFLVFQWDSKNNVPDLYVADPNSVKQKYVRFRGALPTDQKSREKIPSLMVLSHLEIDPSKLPFFVKKDPVKMVRAADLGIEGKVIETQWNNQKGQQTVASGGYVVIEDNGHCYTVAPDANGLPIGYMKV
jgi:hypothetical protein